jgi:hypothetical protein
MCINCYQKFRKEHIFKFKSGLFKTTPETRQVSLLNNLSIKYGFELIAKLCDLTHKQYASLTDISEEYGVSRERVRQWYSIIFKHGYGDKLREKSEQRRNDAVPCRHDPRIKLAEISDGLIRKGAIGEYKFMNECVKRGYDVRPSCNRTIDQVVNGFMVEIKSSYVAKKLYGVNKGSAHYHNFNFTNKQYELADFFAFYHGTSDSFFIVPKTSIPLFFKENQKTKTVYISSHILNHHVAKNRLWEYKDAWHLLSSNDNNEAAPS